MSRHYVQFTDEDIEVEPQSPKVVSVKESNRILLLKLLEKMETLESTVEYLKTREEIRQEEEIREVMEDDDDDDDDDDEDEDEGAPEIIDSSWFKWT
tara:strand:+ start:417 stop:707 length:291 start_codon:yes stop_codon:yes gene_type:complete